MNKLYSVHDHWTDINKKNDVDIESIDGVITGIKVNGEDYGGSEYQNIYDNTINTVLDDGGVYTTSIGVVIEADSIRVTFDGVEYICPKRNISGVSTNFYGAPSPAETEESFDWTDFPFSIAAGINGVSTLVITQTAGSHTLKIDIPQNGGSSDFSTAEVTIIGNNGAMGFMPPSFPYVADNNTTVTMDVQEENSHIYTVVLYKGSAWGVVRGADIIAMTGGVELSQDEEYLIITGDGTLTINPW